MLINFDTLLMWTLFIYIGMAILAVAVIFGWIFWKQRNKEFDGKYEDQERSRDP